MDAPDRSGACRGCRDRRQPAISFARDVHQPFPVLAGFETWQLAFVPFGLPARDGVCTSRSRRWHRASTAAPKENTPRRGVHEPDRGAPPAAGKSAGGNHRPAPGPSRRSVALTLPALLPRARLPLRQPPFARAPA
ncbi:hypothetical protein DF044_14305 [Burkholderia contaminans]|nr:hypothetical protein DF044_14305 [Burkholderia contaminans]RQT29014.1 hypothetical protein DF036_26730 [Burkholderia contaminans]